MSEYIMSPDRINGIPVCSRQKCKCFASRSESGWGISSTNYMQTIYRRRIGKRI